MTSQSDQQERTDPAYLEWQDTGQWYGRLMMACLRVALAGGGMLLATWLVDLALTKLWSSPPQITFAYVISSIIFFFGGAGTAIIGIAAMHFFPPPPPSSS